MTPFKTKLVSFLQSFLGNLITAIAIAVSVLPDGTILNPEFWKTGGAISLLGAALRSAVKKTWQVSAPVSFGGKK